MNERSPKTDELLQNMNFRAEEFSAKRRQEIEAAKTNSLHDKEVFNIEEFRKFYSTTDYQGQSLENQTMLDDLEHQYYVQHPEIKTMSDFLEIRENLDGHNTN